MARATITAYIANTDTATLMLKNSLYASKEVQTEVTNRQKMNCKKYLAVLFGASVVQRATNANNISDSVLKNTIGISSAMRFYYITFLNILFL